MQLFPQPPDFRSAELKARKDGELFWVIENGLSFAGMPAFKQQFSDQETWSLVGYIRALQNAPDPSSLAALLPAAVAPEQLPAIDPTSRDPAARGAAIYFAQGCQSCHGARGDAAGDLNIARRGGREPLTSALRRPLSGMPCYPASVISDPQAQDLAAYIAALAPATVQGSSAPPGGRGSGAFPGGPPRPGGPNPDESPSGAGSPALTAGCLQG